MVEFDRETHTYRDGDKILISVTQLLRKHGLAPDYSGASDAILNAKAARGTVVHEELEQYVKHGYVGFTTECEQFILAMDGATFLASEKLVHNDIVAGTFDLAYELGEEKTLADYKTTATLHKHSVAWQLSLYEYLSGETFDALKAFHFTADGLKIVPIERIPTAEIERLLDCERNGELYTQDLQIAEIGELSEIEKLIQTIDAEKKRAEARAKELRAAVLAAMKQNGIKSSECGRVKFTYIAPSTRQTIDKARLKKDHPDIFAEYQKTTEVSENLKITIKE